MVRSLLRCLLIAAASNAISVPVADLSDGRTGELEFYSVTPTGHLKLRTATFDKTPSVIRGRLLKPNVAPGVKVPAVIVAHGSSGVQPHDYSKWAHSIVSAGYAVMVID